MINLIIFLTLLDPIATDESVKASINSDFETSEKLMTFVKNKKEVHHYYKMINSFYLNNKPATEKQIEILEQIFYESLPERYKVLTALIKEDLKNWQTDDLGDIARDMRNVTDRLRNASSIKQTRKIQEEIVEKLTKLIEEKEGKNKDQDSDADADGSDSDSSHTSKPAPDSGIKGGSGTGEAHNKTAKKDETPWGRHMQREMEQRTERIRPEYSPRHRLHIENYYRKLAEKSTRS